MVIAVDFDHVQLTYYNVYKQNVVTNSSYGLSAKANYLKMQ